MSLKITLSSFNQNYIYTADGTLDSWTVGTPDSDGKYRMDCEDYCLTLQAKVEGFDNLELYYCKYNGEGHCVGKLGNQWIDNIQMKLIDKLHEGYTEVKKYNLFVVWSKLIVGKIMRIFK